MTLNRRDALRLMGSSAALSLPTIGHAAPAAAQFLHGVASGDPAADGAVLWTRATPAADGSGDIPLDWHVAASSGGAAIATGRTTARAPRDFTAKVEPTGLKPGTDYWFWFTTADGTASPRGRFRTLPRGATADLALAVVSCQLYPGGYWHAYTAIAAEPRLDAVLHLGDYIYEYGAQGYGAEIGRALNRLPEPRHEIVTLADYRMRHAQTKRDPAMQAAHARAAFICVWDDHESANDAWVGGAENHDAATEGDWATRKAAAMQAYFEWMPIRDPKPGQPWAAINRSFDFGDLATLVMVETRLLARSEQAASKGAGIEPDDYATMLAIRARPGRELLGARQQAWVERELARSVAAKRPWQLLGNQVVMARVPGPDLAKELGEDRYAALLARLPAAYRPRIAAGQRSYRAGLPFNFDSWDGYPPARERLYAAFRRAKSRPIVLSGDSHAGWANDLHDDAGRLVANEFGATAISSPSYGALLPGLGAVIEKGAPEVRYCDQDRKGYLLLTLTPAHAEAQFRTVSSVVEPEFTTATTARWRVAAGKPGPMTQV
ncbi:alkaline phosphatase D family protein [Sphingomonas sp. 2R-10]|uniref:alkaline phosphatase D family protein n=1 Tax=Sphingomonas sp. 2R-10 TaxID=3045148 RepID=UPI000F78BAAA|nr:alkaline phosphatase D family protein [Sphingomonas sp. 2R-10]MDJ0278717.1 alkaline phosphatase D family protein [Sphingomonas sp. 2R-10]